ncbi:hypothetical protein [Consotaella aegiceratis]|uniref:hypothetical protein n=1 Tax=Consotaella aegiceratis TaxID=3097961 RepID=UPI002F42647E
MTGQTDNCERARQDVATKPDAMDSADLSTREYDTEKGSVTPDDQGKAQAEGVPVSPSAGAVDPEKAAESGS